MSDTDLYAISGRMKNLVSRRNLDLLGAGTVMINTLTLFLKELHDLSDTLPLDRKALKEKLFRAEEIPCYIMSVVHNNRMAEEKLAEEKRRLENLDYEDMPEIDYDYSYLEDDE